jgi:T-complex protein 1 subunit delta
LAENAGLNPIEVVTELRTRHALGYQKAGINVKTGKVVNDIMDRKYNVKQPTLVTESAL